MSESNESLALQVSMFREYWHKAYWEESDVIESTFENPTLLDLLSGSLRVEMHLPQISYLVNSLWGQVADAVDCAIPDLGQSIDTYIAPKNFKGRRYDVDAMMAKMLKESVHKKSRVKNGGNFIASARWYLVDLGST